MTRTISALLAAGIAAGSALPVAADELNLYSSRHYNTDEQLYSEFTEATGITVNVIEGNADELIERILAEGNNSPADVFITVDASRLYRAIDAGVLAPLESEILEERIPAHLQDAENRWFGFSQRSRIIFYSRETVENPPGTYADLADPRYEGMVCARTSRNTYNQTLLAAMITHLGEDGARDWAAGVVRNFARDPEGGDIDQLRALVSGECQIAISNSYYFARAIRREVRGVTEHLEQIGWVFPDQGGNGAHMNLSGGGMAINAPHPEAARLFLEYLSSDSAQAYYSAGNDEYPAVAGAELAESIASLGEFQADEVSLSDVANNIPAAQRIFNEVNWP